MSYTSDLAFAHQNEPILDNLYNILFTSPVERFADDTPEQMNLHCDLKIGSLLLEEKIVRSKNYNAIYVEEMSCPKTNAKGWIYTSKADVLVWNFVESNKKRVYFINFKKLQRFYETNKNKYSLHTNDTFNGTTGRRIPLSDIEKCIVYGTEIL